MGKKRGVVLPEKIQHKILLIRSDKVMIDSDLAQLYGVTTKRLNEQVKRNRARFPIDFMFQLTPEEKEKVVANCDHLHNLKFSSTRPYAFTEHGAIMLASVLNSRKAVEVSILVVRAFVKLRQLLLSHKQLFEKLREIEMNYEKHDQHIITLYKAIRELIEPKVKQSKRQIGFRVEEPRTPYLIRKKVQVQH